MCMRSVSSFADYLIHNSQSTLNFMYKCTSKNRFDEAESGPDNGLTRCRFSYFIVVRLCNSESDTL